MFERFTVDAREVVVTAQREARELHHGHIGTEHLLLGLLTADAGVAHTVLAEAGIDRLRVRADIERLVGSPGRILSDEDAAALQTIGIDLDEVLASIEKTFGPDALQPACPPTRRRGRRRRQNVRPPFAPRAKKVLELSLREAVRLKDTHIGSEHVLLGLLREGNGLAAKILVGKGIDLAELRQRTLDAMDKAA